MQHLYSVYYCHLNHIQPPSLFPIAGWWRLWRKKSSSNETQLQIQRGDFQRVWDRDVRFWCYTRKSSTIHLICINQNECLFYSNVEPKKRRPVEEQEYEETPQEKKLRLAKLYIDQLKEEGEFALWIKIYNFTQYKHGYLLYKITFLRGTESRWWDVWKWFGCWETSRRSGKRLIFNTMDVV